MDILRLLKDRAYRKWALVWLVNRRRPRYAAGQRRAFGYQLEVADHISVVHQFLDIFVNHEYRMPKIRDGAVIVDVGANVGVSVLYFCKHHADPEIHAFEPDPEIFSKLKANVDRYAQGKRVHLKNQAAYTSNASLRFAREGADGGHVQMSPNVGECVDVEGIDLLGFLDRFERVDLLKIDIEGAESDVVPHCAPAFSKIDRLFIEYHSSPGREQHLPELLVLLKRSGYRVNVQSALTQGSPFVATQGAPFDNQLNIFAYRAAR
jgi:FkbM family methyltransferase